MIDLDGRVVGINVAVVRGQGFGSDVAEGLGFAIPSNTARTVVDQLVSKGSVERPFIGISYQAITPQIAAYYKLSREQGILVSEVVAGSPAEKAGLKEGDLLLSINGKDFEDVKGYSAVFFALKPGDEITLSYERAGKKASLKAVITTKNRSDE